MTTQRSTADSFGDVIFVYLMKVFIKIFHLKDDFVPFCLIDVTLAKLLDWLIVELRMV